jgi:hypothetical protein
MTPPTGPVRPRRSGRGQPGQDEGAESGDGEGGTLADRPGNETDRDDAGGTSGIEEADLGVGGVQGTPGKQDELGVGRRGDEVD